MTILEKNRLFNILITNGYAERKETNDDFVFKYTLNGNVIHCIDRFAEYNMNIDYMINSISNDARRAYFIEKILKSVGIVIGDIEEKYNILISSSYDFVLCKKENNSYTFVEFNDQYLDDYAGYGKDIKVVKLNLDNNDLTYDHIDLVEFKYYHADSKISEYTLSKIGRWGKYRLTQNNLYDVIAEDAQMPKYECAWNGMNQYGNLICDLDINKLDRNICGMENIVENEKIKVYYL